MKLNYRDNVILLVLLSIIIVVAGIFGLIKPKNEDIKTDEAKLKTVKADWAAMDDKIKAIPGITEDIEDDHEEYAKLASDFVDRELISSLYEDDTYKLDQFMQPHIDACNTDGAKLEAKSVEVGKMSTATLSYYYFRPNVLTSTMFDAADINGNYQKEIDEVMEESNALSQRTEETVLRTQFGLAAEANKQGVWAFMEKINSLNTAILIDSVNIADYSFGEDKELEEGETPKDTSDVTFVVSLYSVFDMDEPIVE